MKKVITYGTYDMLHKGHIRLLERARALGDYLIVGVTSDTFDRARGKINVKQSLQERMEAIKATGLADEVIVEEYEGQKIDDIRRYDIDIFTVGSDWIGKFDYLKEYCEVCYLERTKGISSSELRTEERKIRIGLIGDLASEINKFVNESKYVNGAEVVGIYNPLGTEKLDKIQEFEDFDVLLSNVDALYIAMNSFSSYRFIKSALKCKKHVLVESPITMEYCKIEELFQIAKDNKCILMESIKTAYSLAFSRLILLVKSGMIGDVISIDSTCTSLRKNKKDKRGSLQSWGPYGLLSIFSFLSTNYIKKEIYTKLDCEGHDIFTKINFYFDGAVSSMKVADGVKSEGELIISGSKGYVYVPAPWWKTDYFEIRQEHIEDNKRYFYQLEGEGIRYMIVCFLKAIKTGRGDFYISKDISKEVSKIMDDFCGKKNVVYL